ncbi:hypothetical protein BaRGS_00021654 [Batillaria attramentaria]|uniref:Uncharacterized protein n=1 Tax=Batillaria attramentaria TaxID=370345 RepID=A0ABD0KIY2_9CAEN
MICSVDSSDRCTNSLFLHSNCLLLSQTEPKVNVIIILHICLKQRGSVEDEKGRGVRRSGRAAVAGNTITLIGNGAVFGGVVTVQVARTHCNETMDKQSTRCSVHTPLTEVLGGGKCGHRNVGFSRTGVVQDVPGG